MLGLLYDVHGNLPALEAVLADAEAAGARALPARRRLHAVRRLAGGDRRAPARARRHLDPRQRRALDRRSRRGARARPAARSAAAGSCSATSWCASWQPCPRRTREDGTPLLPRLAGLRRAQLPARARRRTRPELLAGVTAEQLVFGHTHLPFERTAAGGIELVNPGSVGMPFDGDHARRLRAAATTTGAVEHRRVAYDHAAARRAGPRACSARTARFPARRIEQARFDVG